VKIKSIKFWRTSAVEFLNWFTALDLSLAECGEYSAEQWHCAGLQAADHEGALAQAPFLKLHGKLSG